jgi:tetrahydromethanopterin S-methyltransferase subunit B
MDDVYGTVLGFLVVIILIVVLFVKRILEKRKESI